MLYIRCLLCYIIFKVAPLLLTNRKEYQHMKKLLAIVLVLCLGVGLCACDKQDYAKAQAAYEAGKYEEAQALFAALGDYEDSAEMAKKSSYMQGRQLMEQGQYAQAITIFEALGEYEDCAKLIDECKVGEIDALLQGSWSAVQLNVIKMDYNFTKGRYHAKMTINSSSIENEGDYRIDLASQSIYIRYDYTINADGSKNPNSEEKLLFTFTYENGTFVLSDFQKNICTKA